jgi:hypothetical protein
MLPSSLQGLATRWLAYLPGRDSHPLDYTTLPGRTQAVSPSSSAAVLYGQNFYYKRLQKQPVVVPEELIEKK